MIRPRRSDHAPVSHGWVQTALFAALVIVGLLGMHTLSTAHTDSTVAAVSPGAMAMDADHSHAALGAVPAETDLGCLDCGSSDSHQAMIMACVLGLLVALLLVCRAKPGVVRIRRQSIVALFLRSALTLQPRPPSLTILSISRT